MKKRIHSNIDISRLLTLHLSGEINTDEQIVLDNWLMENESHQQLLQDLVSKELYKDRQALISRIDMTKEWTTFQKKIAPEKKVIGANWMSVLKYAAVIALPLLIGTYILIQDYTHEDFVAHIPVEIEPGVKKAQLVLSNGERIELGENALDLSLKEKSVNIENKNQSLNYTTTDNTNEKLVYNQLLIGRGEEYQLVLADGTKVWLNSESKLTYPIQFADNIRKVELEGEGYFEVTKNPNAPFIVKTKQINIEVLGTSFNVSAYQDEELMKTTLVEGSVKVTANFGTDEARIIKPDEQVVFDVSTNEMILNYVNAKMYGRWREGVFSFEEDNLEEIMRKLSRWYDIKVFFQDNNARDYHFSGKLPRFENCNDLFEMIEKTTNVKFEIKNNETVLVSTRKQ